ncbi:MAG: hypothetical protein VKK98_05955 [Cyanobacteriota bacterium]|nr:hypothetical protein [Cyanobacteriota bacterium]
MASTPRPPELVLLDLLMPEIDGDAYVLKPDLFENLARIVEEHLRGAPVLEV